MKYNLSYIDGVPLLGGRICQRAAFQRDWVKLVKLVKVSSQERGCLETPANTLKCLGDFLCVFSPFSVHEK